MVLTNVKYLERGLRMSGDKLNADLVRDMDAELATLRAELAKANEENEKLREAMTKAAHVLKVKQPDKLDDARSLLIEALA